MSQIRFDVVFPDESKISISNPPSKFETLVKCIARTHKCQPYELSMVCRPKHGEEFLITNQEEYWFAMQDVLYIKASSSVDVLPTPDFRRNMSAEVIQMQVRRRANASKKTRLNAVCKIQRQVRMFLLNRPFPQLSKKEDYLAECLRRFYLLKLLFVDFAN